MGMLKAGGETERPFQARTDRVIDVISITLNLPWPLALTKPYIQV